MKGAVANVMVGATNNVTKIPGNTKAVSHFTLICCPSGFVVNNRLFFSITALLLCLIIPAVASSEEFATLDEFKALGEKFDHLTTGYALTGEHGQLDCGECHIGGVFETLPRECEACHDNVIATGIPSVHVETTAPCDTCHTTSGFISTAVMDHSTVTGSCASCHDSVAATGKSPNHVATTNVCEACHTTNIWAPVRRFDHAHSIGSCVSCHNNTIEAGKPADHMQTTDACEACHSYARVPPWDSEGSAVDHAEVLGRCSFCHDGVITIGKDADHLVTTEECNACHTPSIPFDQTQPPT